MNCALCIFSRPIGRTNNFNALSHLPPASCHTQLKLFPHLIIILSFFLEFYQNLIQLHRLTPQCPVHIVSPSSAQASGGRGGRTIKLGTEFQFKFRPDQRAFGFESREITTKPICMARLTKKIQIDILTLASSLPCVMVKDLPLGLDEVREGKTNSFPSRGSTDEKNNYKITFLRPLTLYPVNSCLVFCEQIVCHFE